jgi:DNA polymerase
MKIDLNEVVTIDFETYYDSKYSLRAKQYNTSSYIMDEKFQMHCCAIKIGKKKSKCYWGREAIEKALKAIDWSRHDLLAHNMFFDGAIAKWHLGITPRRRFCTVQMTRGLHSDMSKASLQNICDFYGIAGKIEGLEDVKGLRSESIPKEKRDKLMAYCNNDNEKCFEVFCKQIAVYPEEEVKLIDLTLSMFCDPVFVLDVQRAEKSLNFEMNERLKFVAISGTDEKTLKSTDKFVEFLAKLGVDAPKKVSKYNGQVTYALSETDPEFVALQDHDDIRVIRAVQGRLAAKSTMMETRAWRMLQAQETCGSLPVLLNYYGAKTGRWSGGNKMNFQNLPTSTKDYPMAGELRKSILAPPGHVIMAPDSAQIEARVVAWVSGHAELLVRFRNKEDVYKWMASMIYGVPVEEIDDEQRFIGKIAVLGLGYGMGPKRFQTTLALGVMGPPMQLTLQECNKIVKLYRKINAPIVGFWGDCETVLDDMCRGGAGSFGPDGILEYEGTSIWLPNGMGLHYPGLRAIYDMDGRRTGFKYKSNGIDKHIYGGLLCENIVQALAGVVIRQEMLEVKEYYDTLKLRKNEVVKIATMTHDEIVSVVPERLAAKALEKNLQIMRKPPKWAPNLPIWAAAEGGYAVNYSV